MKKEYLAVAVLGLFILAYVLDYVAGPISLTLTSPLQFLDETILAKYPFTATSVIIRTLGLFSTILLIFSFAQKRWFIKAALMLFLIALLELYAIQQLATGMAIVPIQWTLSFALTGVSLLIPTVVYVLLGIVALVLPKTKPKNNLQATSPTSSSPTESPTN